MTRLAIPTAASRVPAAPAPVLRTEVRHNAARGATLFLLTVAASGATLLLPAALGHALDLVLRHRGGAAVRWAVLCALLGGASTVLEAAAELLSGLTSARSTARLRHRLAAGVVGAGPGATRRLGAGDLVTRAVANTADAGAVPGALAGAASCLVTPVGALVALGLTDIWLAAVFVAGVPALVLLTRAFARATGDASARYQRAQGEIAARLSEAIGGARTVAAAGTHDRERRRVLRPLPELGVQGRRVWRVLGRAGAQTVVLVPVLQMSVLAVAGLRLAQHGITVGQLLAVSRYAVLATGIGVLTAQLGTLVRGRAAAGRIEEALAVPAAGYGRRRLPDGPGTLELHGVSVLRDGTAVLRRVDLLVPGGTSMAVVGRSGTGKSALAAVAGRLSDPDRGVVTLDGVPLWELAHDALRGQVAFAFERPVLLGGTLGGTIAFGAAEPGRSRIERAARAARADGFVGLLPDGYDTACARAPLSGGEIQRLGLARAFAHAGRLMILDDATSSLDTVTEREVSRAVLRELPATTRLVVAHRAATAARCDRVAWLEDGRLRAVAPHAELWRLAAYRAVFGEETACCEDGVRTDG